MTGNGEYNRFVPSSFTETGARRRRLPVQQPSKIAGGLHSLVITIVSICAININKVAAFHCVNRISRMTVKNERSPHGCRFCAILNGGKGLMLSDSLRHRIDISCNRQSNRSQAQRLSIFGMSTKDDDIAVQQTNSRITKSVNEKTSVASETSKTSSRSSLSRTFVLAVPLMLKFALVLIIKFLTDLVVFPLLFTYRGARIMKRRIFKIWNRWTLATTTTKTVNNTEGESLNLENYIVNGSSIYPDNTTNA